MSEETPVILETTSHYVQSEAVRIFDSMVQLQSWAVEYGLRSVGAIITLVIGWTLSKWISSAVGRYLRNSHRIDNTLADYAQSLVRVLILCITAIAVLAKFGVETASIVGVFTAASLAIGLALQGTLANFAAGVMLLLFRPFKESELVQIGGNTGTVKTIGIFATELRPASGEFVLIPNGQVWGATITNYTRNGTRRVELAVDIDYGANHLAAAQMMVDLANAHPKILDEPAPSAALRELGDNGVTITLLAWTLAGDMFNTRLELMSQTKVLFDQKGISFPFPQRDLRIVNDEPIRLDLTTKAG